MIPQPDGNVTNFTGNRIWEVFSPGQMMEGDVMDFLIDDWKQDPERNGDFASEKRILLSPYFISVINQIGFFLLNKTAYLFLRVLIILLLVDPLPLSIFYFGFFAGCA